MAGPVTVTLSLIRHGNIDSLPFELSIVNLIDDPTVGGYVVTGHDVTERRVADHELRTALSLLQATLDATADGILAVGTDGQLVSFNQRLAEMWRIPDSVLNGAEGSSVAAYVRDQLLRPGEFVSTVETVADDLEAESNDVLEFKDGRVFERVSKPQTVDGAIVGRVWSFRDITDRKRLEERLSYQAFHDSLTGLANRALFQDRLQHAVARIERTGSRIAVLFLDLDNLKVVNDTLGHTAGDALLRATADVIVGCIARLRHGGPTGRGRVRDPGRGDCRPVRGHRIGPTAAGRHRATVARVGSAGIGHRQHRHRLRLCRDHRGPAPVQCRHCHVQRQGAWGEPVRRVRRGDADQLAVDPLRVPTTGWRPPPNERRR